MRTGSDAPFLLLLVLVLIGGVITAYVREPSQNLVRTEGGFQLKDR